jgi:subtilase family serine protease
MYFGQDLSDQDVIKVFSQFTDDADGPRQASASYGECEQVPYLSSALSQVPVLGSLPYGIGLGNNIDDTLDQITEQAAAEGKTVFVSTGDTGSSCPAVVLPIIGAGNGLVNQGLPLTNSPASLPYVTAVGGTVLYTDGEGHRTHEYGWTFSGGGSTLFTPAPDYQQGVTGNALPCVTDPTVTCRGISDVAAQSGDALTNGFDIVSDGADTLGGGTSLSAPLMQGLWADVQSSAPTAAGYGFANYGLYAAGKNAAADSFFDVSSFDPEHGLPATNGLYPTLPGWDYVTGWGTPRVAGLADYLAGAAGATG